MKSLSVFLLSLLTAITMNAQVINGDLNHNDNLDVEDVTLLIDGYLTGASEVIETNSDYYKVDNSLIVAHGISRKTSPSFSRQTAPTANSSTVHPCAGRSFGVRQRWQCHV